jgi:branched-subunit amino acid ABC-type transport system permease component
VIATVISILVDATLITLVLALAASGLAVIFGLVGVINMGHGAMLTLGAYFAWALVSGGMPFLLAALLAAIGVGLIGLILEVVLIRHFYDRPFETLLLTWGFFLVATELIKIIFGSDFRSIPEPLPGTFNLGFAEVPAYRTLIGLFTIGLLVAMGLIYYRTGLGIRIRALIQNREVASLLGLNVRALYRWVFAGGAFLAGLAGALISPMLSIDPYIGNVFLVRSFFVVTVGGLGQLLGGTVLGSFIIGGSETLFALVTSQTFAQTIVFVLAILILRFRPRGILAQQN